MIYEFFFIFYEGFRLKGNDCFYMYIYFYEYVYVCMLMGMIFWDNKRWCEIVLSKVYVYIYVYFSLLV